MSDHFLRFAASIVRIHEPYLLDSGPDEQTAEAVRRLEHFHTTTPLRPVLDTVIDLAGFGEAPVLYRSDHDQYLLLSQVAEQLGMPLWKAHNWARQEQLWAIEDQRRADEERGDGRLGYDYLRGVVDLGLHLIKDNPEAKPDAGGKRWSHAGEWLLAHDRLPAFICSSPWSREFIDNISDHLGMAMRRVWGENLKNVATYDADGNPTGGNMFTDLCSTELTEEEALHKARRGPGLETI